MSKEFKHTPGPWVLDPCGDILGNRNTKTDNGLVCAMCSDRRDDEGRANARLITAAPDLLEALNVLINLNENDGPFGGEIWKDTVDRAWDKARSAIAKARGE